MNPWAPAALPLISTTEHVTLFGSLVLANGQARGNNASGETLVEPAGSKTLNWADSWVELEITTLLSTGQAAAFLRGASTNGFLCLLSSDGSAQVSTWDGVGLVWVAQLWVASPGALALPCVARFECRGSQITIDVNGRRHLTWTGATAFTSGRSYGGMLLTGDVNAVKLGTVTMGQSPGPSSNHWAGPPRARRAGRRR